MHLRNKAPREGCELIIGPLAAALVSPVLLCYRGGEARTGSADAVRLLACWVLRSALAICCSRHRARPKADFFAAIDIRLISVHPVGATNDLATRF